MAEVAVKFTGDPAAMQRALDAVIRNQERMEQGFKRIKGEARSAGSAAEKGFDLGSLTRWVGGLALARTALQAITSEIRLQWDLQRQARETQVTVAGSRKEILRNLPGVSDADRSFVLAQASKIAQEVGIDEKAIGQGIAQALSASGVDIPASLSAVRQAARFIPDRPDAMGLFAGGMLDLAKVTGSKDAATNQGLLAFVAGLSRVVDPLEAAHNIPRSLIGQMQFGADPRSASALFSALSVGGADVQGRISGAAAIGLAQQLREFFGQDPKELRKERKHGPATPLEQFLKGGADPGDMLGRIQTLQGSPDLAKQFLKTADFEKVVRGPIEGLLTNAASFTAQEFQKNLSLVLDNDQLKADGEKMIQSFLLDPLEHTAKRQRAIDTAAQQIRLAQGPDARAEQEREGFINTMKVARKWGYLAEGVYGVGEGIASAVEWAGFPLATQEETRTTRLGVLRGTASEFRQSGGEGEVDVANAIDRLVDVMQETNTVNAKSGSPTYAPDPRSEK